MGLFCKKKWCVGEEELGERGGGGGGEVVLKDFKIDFLNFFKIKIFPNKIKMPHVIILFVVCQVTACSPYFFSHY